MSTATLESSRVCMKLFVVILVNVRAERSDVLVPFHTIPTRATPCLQGCHSGGATRRFRDPVESSCKRSQDDIAVALRT
jgi:hypothetical protein